MIHKYKFVVAHVLEPSSSVMIIETSHFMEIDWLAMV